MSLPSIRPIRTAEELNLVMKIAREDGHVLFDPSHLVIKEGKIIGAVSMVKTPYVSVWMHTKEARATDSVVGLNSVEAVMENAGVNHYIMPCTEDSPFHPVMDKLGFQYIGMFGLYIKNLGSPLKVESQDQPQPIPFQKAQ